MKKVVMFVTTVLASSPAMAANDLSQFVRQTLDPTIQELQRADGLPMHTALQISELTGSIIQYGAVGASIDFETYLPGAAYASIGAGWNPIFAPRVIYLARNCQALYKQLDGNRDLFKQRLAADYIVGLSMVLDLVESSKMQTVRQRGKIGDKIYLAKDLPVMRSLITSDLKSGAWATAAKATVPLMESADAVKLPKADPLRNAYLLNRKHASKEEWSLFVKKCSCTASL